MHTPINTYVRRARVYRGAMLLSSTEMSIQEIADRLHFCSRSYFAEAFQKETGFTPSEFREANVKQSQ